MGSPHGYLPIEEHGIVGDLRTVALIGTDGTVDWFCPARFDAPSLFGALLDKEKGGYFSLAARTSYAKPKQRYLPDTNILLTRFQGRDAVGEVIDFMVPETRPVGKARDLLVRQARAVKGTARFEVACHPAFDYGRLGHRVEIVEGVGAVFTSPIGRVVLRTNVGLKVEEAGVAATFTLKEGEEADFHLEWNGDLHPIAEGETRRLFSKTQDFWRNWVGQCRYTGRWREVVQRSALALKLLVYHPTGALIAAPTTSLPEEPGGTRNWDYRYVWLRDASFTVYSLMRLGFLEEAASFMDWLQQRCETASAERDISIMYTVDGRDHILEETLDHLEGYNGARPVRIGNGAADQLQIDVYGEIMDSVYLYNKEAPISWDLWTALSKRLDWLSDHWTEPDEGIWEIRGPRQRFTYSALMTWVAYDRAGRLARDRGLPAPVERWRKLGAEAYRFVQEQCWDPGSAELRHASGQRPARRVAAGDAQGQVRRADRSALPVHPGEDQRRAGLRQPGQPVRHHRPRRHRRRRGHLQPLLVLVRRGPDPGRPRARGQGRLREDAHLQQPPGPVRGADRPLGRGARQFPPGLHSPGPDQRRRQPEQGPGPPDRLAKTIKTSPTAGGSLPTCQAPSSSSGRRPCPGSPSTPTPPPRPPSPG